MAASLTDLLDDPAFTKLSKEEQLAGLEVMRESARMDLLENGGTEEHLALLDEAASQHRARLLGAGESKAAAQEIPRSMLMSAEPQIAIEEVQQNRGIGELRAADDRRVGQMFVGNPAENKDEFIARRKTLGSQLEAGKIDQGAFSSQLTELQQAYEATDPDTGLNTPVISLGRAPGNDIPSGIVNGVTTLAEGLTTPLNIGLMATIGSAPAVVARAASTYFAAESIKGLGEIAPEAVRAVQEGRKGDAAELITQGIGAAAIGATALAHASPVLAEVTTLKSKGLTETARAVQETAPLEPAGFDGPTAPSRIEAVTEARKTLEGTEVEVTARTVDGEQTQVRLDAADAALEAARHREATWLLLRGFEEKPRLEEAMRSLDENTLSPEERELLRNDAQRYRANGRTPEEAGRQAVLDFQSDANQRVAEVRSQLPPEAADALSALVPEEAPPRAQEPAVAPEPAPVAAEAVPEPAKPTFTPEQYTELMEVRRAANEKTPAVEPTPEERQAIIDSWRAKAKETGFHGVWIADVLENAGFTPETMDRGRGIVIDLANKGEIHSLSTGDWSIANDRERAWAVIQRPGSPATKTRAAGSPEQALQMRFGKEFLEESTAPKPAPEAPPEAQTAGTPATPAEQAGRGGTLVEGEAVEAPAQPQLTGEQRVAIAKTVENTAKRMGWSNDAVRDNAITRAIEHLEEKAAAYVAKKGSLEGFASVRLAERKLIDISDLKENRVTENLAPERAEPAAEDLSPSEALERAEVEQKRTEALKEIEFTPEEQQLLDAMQEAGTASAGAVADKLGIHRSTAYARFNSIRAKAQRAAKDGGFGASPFIGEGGIGAPSGITGRRIPVSPLPAPLGGGKKLSDIVLDLSKGLDKGVRVGLVPRKFGGMYLPVNSGVTIRFAGDLGTTAHEIGHFLSDKHGLGAPWYKARARSPYDAELEPFWQHGSKGDGTLRYKREEGVAEWIRAWVSDPAAAEAAAPKFASYFLGKVPGEVLSAMRSFSNDVRTWAGTPDAQRVLANVRMEAPSLGDRVRDYLAGQGYGFRWTVLDRLRAGWQDSLWPAVKAYREGKAERGLGKLKPEQDFEVLARLYQGFNGKFEAVLERGLVNERNEPLADPGTGRNMSLRWLLDWADSTSRETITKDVNDAVSWMVSERVLEKAAQVDQALAKEVATLDPVKDAKRIDRLTEQAQIRKQRLAGIGGGLISDVDAARLALGDLQKDPVRQAKAQEGARRYREWAKANIDLMKDAGLLTDEAHKAILDRNRFYVDMHRVIDNVEHGRQLGSALARAPQLLHTMKGSTREIADPFGSLLEQTFRIRREVDRNNVMLAFTDAIKGTRQMHQGPVQDLAKIGTPAMAGERGAIKVMRNGKAEYWLFDPELQASLKGMSETASGPIVEVLSKFGTVLRYGVTHSPGFIVRNVIRDAIHRGVISDAGSKPWDILRPFDAEDRLNFKVFGGDQAGHYATDRVSWTKQLGKAQRELAENKNFFYWPEKALEGWHNLSKGSEMLGRMAEFRRAFDKAKAEGLDDYNANLLAAAQARGLMDFAMAGTIMRDVNRIIPFTNARVQGLVRTASAALDNPGTFALRWGTYVLAPSLLVYLWNQANGSIEEWRQQADYVRDLFYSVKVAPDLWLRIPRPFELGVLAAGVDRAIDRALGNERAFEGYGGMLLKSTLPLDDTALGGPFRAILEDWANYDYFRGKYIIPPHEEGTAIETRNTERASRIGKLIQEGTGWDGRKADHFITAQFGGLGDLAQSVSNSGREDRPFDPAAASGVFVHSPAYSAKDVQFVLGWAREQRKTSTSQIKELNKMVSKYFTIETSEARDAQAAKVRDRALQLRAQIDSGTGWGAPRKPKKK